MSRSRNIKPGFFRNEVLASLPFEFRLLFVGLWTMADRAGRLEDRPMKIRMELFAADPVDVEAGLQSLHDNGFITRYRIDFARFIQVNAWGKHQNPHVKEAASTIPAPDKHSSDPVEAPKIPERAGLIPDSLNLIPDSRVKATVQPAVALSRFAEFWSVYPNKKGKQEAESRWRKSKLDGMADQIIAHVLLMSEEDDSWARGYAPMGSTYLNQARWTDVPQGAPTNRAAPGKQMTGLMALEEMKHGMVPQGNNHGNSEAGLLGFGAPAGRGSPAGNGHGLVGSAGRPALESRNGHATDSRGVLDLGADSYRMAEPTKDD